MTLTVEIEPELDSLLRKLAEAEGVSVEQYVRRLVARAVRTRSGSGALALLREWDSEDATDDPEEAVHRKRDWEAFREAMNRSHSSDRVLYP